MNTIYLLVSNNWDNAEGKYKAKNIIASTDSAAIHKKTDAFRALAARLLMRDDSLFCEFVGRNGRSFSRTMENLEKLTSDEFEFISLGFNESTVFEIQKFANLTS